MNIQLSEHFTYNKLLRFTLPSIVMMVFTSIYGVVDGFFVSNYVGKTPFAAVNFIMPFLMVLGAVGFMLGTGGSALISKTMGEGNNEKARSIFSLLVYTGAALGIVIAALGIIFIKPVAVFLGAEGDMLDYCVIYGRIILLALPALILQFEFQTFFVTAEKPQLGLAVTVAAGAANMILDWLFMAVFEWGVVGAASATAISQAIGGLAPLFYFASKNNSLLRLTKTSINGSVLLKTTINGSSELMSNISMSIVGMLYNAQLMKYAGEDGVAAYGVLMYINFVFISMFIGYSVGTAPIVGYHFGALNHAELKNLLKRSAVIIGIFSVCMFAAAQLLASPLSALFVGYDAELMSLTLRGFRISSFSYLFAGIAIYGSSFFTALNDGLTSALISFLRTLVFQIAAVMILPLILDIDGIWVSVAAAEVIAATVTLTFIFGKRNKFHYM